MIGSQRRLCVVYVGVQVALDLLDPRQFEGANFTEFAEFKQSSLLCKGAVSDGNLVAIASKQDGGGVFQSIDW